MHTRTGPCVSIGECLIFLLCFRARKGALVEGKGNGMSNKATGTLRFRKGPFAGGVRASRIHVINDIFYFDCGPLAKNATLVWAPFLAVSLRFRWRATHLCRPFAGPWFPCKVRDCLLQRSGRLTSIDGL